MSAAPLTLQTSSEDQTRQVGINLGAALRDGDLVLLHGHFGAGKTVLVQGMAVGLGISDPVTSPSFVLMVEHVEHRKLVHVDFFRIERADSDLLASIEDYLDGEWIVAIEWPDWIPASLAGNAIHVTIEPVSESERRIRIEADQAVVNPIRAACASEMLAEPRT